MKYYVTVFMLVAIVILAFSFAGCTSEDEARYTLEASGFTEIQTHGTKAWACGEKDKSGREFTAVNPRGVTVTGVVCCGQGWKYCTIRF